MNEEIKYCPFCGSRPFFSESFKEKGFAQIKVYSAWCRHHTCPVRPVIEDDRSMDYVKKRWNTRTKQPTSNTFEAQLKIALKALNTINDVKECTEEQGLALAEYFNYTARKALEEITALNDNVGGN